MTEHSSGTTQSLQQWRCLAGRTVGSTFALMSENESRRAKVTPETKAESVRLALLWKTRAHPTQAEFGETYGIGNQSAVGQFLRGDVPLSLKAARGFAMGLGCNIEDFSPRLALEAASISNMVPGDPLVPEVAAIAAALNKLPKKWRDWALKSVAEVVNVARESAQMDTAQRQTASDSGKSEPSYSPVRAKRK